MDWVTTINGDQFRQLLEKLGHTDWVGLWAQLLIAIIAALSGLFAQMYFERKRNTKIEIELAYRFNEAVAYLGAILEEISAHIAQLLLPEFGREQGYKKELECIFQKPLEPSDGILNRSFLIIGAIEITSVDELITKIPDVGGEVEIVQVFYRLRNQTLQLKTASEARTSLIKDAVEQRARPINLREIQIRFVEIHDLTGKMLMSAESIFDCTTYLSIKLRAVAENISKNLKSKRIKGIKVSKLVSNSLHEELRKQLMELIDKIFPEQRGRMLHMRPPTQ